MIILGIDPGTATTGYGVIEKIGSRTKYITCGVILTPKEAAMPDRLRSIYDQLCEIIDKHQPDAIVTEQLFFSTNVTTGLQVGRAVGVVLLAASQRNIPWREYRPAEVKMAVVGFGAAEKKQVQFMVARLLGLKEAPKPDDVADALAIAITHAFRSRIII